MQVNVSDAGITFGPKTVFSALSATFPARTLTALVGPSGSGKSSLLAAIAGYQRLSTGSISFEEDGVRVPVSETSVTWISQSASSLGARTVIDNVLIGPLAEGVPFAQAIVAARNALANVGLEGRERERVKQLSGGEVQRVAFARGLASRKPVLLADEPSASLDEVNTRNIASLLHRLRGQATIIVATHDPILVSSAQASVSLRPA